MICIVQSAADIEQLIACISQASYCALDTEFERRKTFYPECCLIQIYATDAFVLDPLLLDSALIQHVLTIMSQKPCIKIVHAGAQDWQICQRYISNTAKESHTAGGKPQTGEEEKSHHNNCMQPIFDTQVAANLLSMGPALGYLDLVERVLGLNLTHIPIEVTSWKDRPLSNEHIAYAVQDVQHLEALCIALHHQLDQMNRAHWFYEDMKHYQAPQKANQLSPFHCAHDAKQVIWMNRLEIWRLLEAQQQNKPKEWVMSNEKLEYLARARSHMSLEEWKIIYENDSFVACLATDWTTREEEQEKWWQNFPIKQPIPSLKGLARQVASTLNVPSHTLISKRDIELLLTEPNAYERVKGARCLSGWRFELFKESFLATLML